MDADRIKERNARWSEIGAFSRLKPGAQKLEMEKLAEKVKAINNAIASNQKASQALENQKSTAENEMKAVKEQYGEARSKRKRCFGEGMDTKDLDAEIWKLHLDIESREALRTDAVAGFENKLSDIQKELRLLEKEKEGTLRTILEFEQVPLIPKFNNEIAQAMKTLEQILDGQEMLNYDLQHNGTDGFRMIEMSTWGWLKTIGGIGKIYFTGCYDEKDQLPSGRLKGTWSLSEYYEQRRRKSEKVASE